MSSIPTVGGSIDASALGRTLMHEHLVIGYPGFESHVTHGGPDADEMFRMCVDRVEQLKELGFRSMVDPCPNDLGRDVELAAKVAQHTGFQIICATGLYKEDEGGHAYWKFRSTFGPQTDAMADLFVHELTEGIGDTGIRAGVIKVATGHGAISAYERTVLEAAAKASVATGAPITTHTDQGTMGPQQQAILTELGVPAQQIVIGHSCGTDDHDYHMTIARGGSYLGFDRFGLEILFPDEKRVAALVRLLRAGAGRQVVVSHDSVWCWRGEPIPPEVLAQLGHMIDPTHLSKRIVPQLRDAGIAEAEIEQLLVDNPRRYFSNEAPPALA